jgi:hypothetical protein
MPFTPSAAIAVLLVAAASMILAMWWLIKTLVADKLNSIKKQLEALTDGMADHGETLSEHKARLTAVETVMQINGCLNGRPRCAS